ncbi:sensor histidine kinase [Phycobacter azelaicus]|jgi:signal transduction histidine kinase|uniref:sensor histidine kinase n=1 Tax=Phycobacter azelaicus TaxID=2668075 RepID=UPI0018690314|nr:hybrid sensor histidine kinase/response regulator [Phycobacter azelaicus]
MLDIMIVDDDIADRKLLRRLLKSSEEDRVFREVSNGRSALEYAEQDIDVIFLDHLLPGLTGLDLLERFVQTWPKAAIILMTGQGDEEIAKTAILQGASDYIPKSIMTSSALNRMVDNGLKLSRMRWKLEEQRRELSLFSDTLVHDLRAPVRAIEFLSEQIQTDFENGQMEDVYKEFDMMKLSVKRMSELIESLASHISLDGSANWEHVSLENLCERVRMALAREISDSCAQLTWETRNLSAYCIAPEIAQLLQNLVANSIKYAGDAVPRVHIDVREIEGGVHIAVSDNGVGIPEAFRKTVFAPFKRLQQTASLPGSGLGLATCQKVAKRHGGDIWCGDEAQSGTTIHLTLKARPDAPDQ